MKKLLVLLLLTVISTVMYSQSMTYLYFNDSLAIESITSSDNSLETVKNSTPNLDRTEDGIYFFLDKTEYIVYIPEVCTVFKVRSRNKYVGDHLIYLIDELRKHKQDLIKFYKI